MSQPMGHTPSGGSAPNRATGGCARRRCRRRGRVRATHPRMWRVWRRWLRSQRACRPSCCSRAAMVLMAQTVLMVLMVPMVLMVLMVALQRVMLAQTPFEERSQPARTSRGPPTSTWTLASRAPDGAWPPTGAPLTATRVQARAHPARGRCIAVSTWISKGPTSRRTCAATSPAEGTKLARPRCPTTCSRASHRRRRRHP
mmetsp:Transcript_19311/g.40366  ORF Transcript_19311/g.40366 Transcript_19311/m.40366 type:complete len:200 (-) Transcript_19311:1228-1827(-)